MKGWRKHVLSFLTLFLWVASALFAPAVPLADAPPPDWSWLSPDLDGDGLPNDVETTGWCNAVGCFQTDPLRADSDGDGLSDGEEKLFESDPTSDASPGMYVVYQDDFNTREYYPWQQYGSRWIARGDDFDPPNPDSVDDWAGRRPDLDAVVVRRGTTFYVGGPPDATLQIRRSSSSLSYLSSAWDPYSGRWRVSVPSNGTAGAYTLTLGDKSMDLFVIFELPTPSGELTRLAIEKFLYDDDPEIDRDQYAILLADAQYDRPYGFVAEGSSYRFENQQYNRFILENYVIEAINGYTSQRGAADALAARVDAETVFRNPRVLHSSWQVLHPGSDPRQQCSNVSGLLTAFIRVAGIPARPVMVDWRNGSFDHATEVWLNGTWRVYRGYQTAEINYAPDDTHIGCEEPAWPACGTARYQTRYDWGRYRYRPWHSGGGGGGNLIILADEDWTGVGLAYRWPSWDVDTIKLDPSRFMTQNAIYWRYWGWNREPTNTGLPGWPSPPSWASASAGIPAPSGDAWLDLPPAVQLGDVVAEYGVDLNGNGQYDQLVLEVEVMANQAGSFQLLGHLGVDRPEPLLMGTGGLIAQAFVPVDLVEGAQVVPLVFGGTEIALKRVDGPYLLKGLWIAGSQARDLVDFMNDSLAYRENPYTTAAYHAAGFETYGAMLADDYAHSDLDSDGDGRPDALVITTSIQVYQEGNYTVRGSLYDGQDEPIAYATWTGSGPEVGLQFDRLAGTFGPYTLHNLDLLNAQGESIDRIVEAYTIDLIPALASPDRAALNIYPVGEGMVALGQAIIPTQVFTESLVDGHLQVEARVQVSEEGAYRLEAWLANAGGDLIAWAAGQPADLPVGMQVLSVTFDGRAIRARGVAGPYTVVALKVLDGDEGYDVLDQVNVAMTTRAYTLDQFAATEAVIALEDFVEGGDDLWDANPPWAIEQGVYFSPSHAWYGTDANATLALAWPMDFSRLVHLVLSFRTAHRLAADGDTGYVEVSADNAHWEVLKTLDSDAAWSTHLLNLNNYAGAERVYLRFRLASRAGAENDGWHIDDVVVAGLRDTDGDGLSDDEESEHGTDPSNPDSDGDGLKDGAEVNLYGTDPTNPDSDDDGMPDGWEVDNNLDPLDGQDADDDPDNDGLTNVEEYRSGSDPADADSDDDGLGDGEEVSTYGTDPADADSDGDGMPDGWEVDNGLDPLAGNDAGDDPDNDGLTNAGEYQHGTEPRDPDSDGDGMPDGWEVDHDLDPLDDGDAGGDPDGDGLTNVEEYQNGADPHNPDSDGDGLEDGDEVAVHGTDPGNPDSDGDGLEDGAEVNLYGTDPTNPDSDDDGMPDGWEVDNNLDPLDGQDADDDPDNDGLTNVEEYRSGTDPHNPDSDGDGILDGEDPHPHAPTTFVFLPIVSR